jgi:hypothetical protein
VGSQWGKAKSVVSCKGVYCFPRRVLQEGWVGAGGAQAGSVGWEGKKERGMQGRGRVCDVREWGGVKCKGELFYVRKTFKAVRVSSQ